MKLDKIFGKDVEEVMKNVDWTRWMQIGIPILQPVLLFGLWLGASKLDKRFDALSKLIAIAEPIPTVDLSIPKPVVLASMYHSLDELADVLSEILKFLKELEVPTAEQIVQEIKEEIAPDPVDPKEILSDFQDCVNGYERDTPDFLKSKTAKGLYIQGCLLRKGYAQKAIKQAIRDWLL